MNAKRDLTVLLIFAGLISTAQTEWNVGGYLKYLPSQTWVNEAVLLPVMSGLIPSSFDDHLIHNRLNITVNSPYEEGPPWWSAEMGVRNRIFFGYQAQTDAFRNSLEADPGVVDMRWLWANADGVLFHTEIDRLNFRYETADYSVKVGRQRINWGIHNVFNPNDIFNQYNYFDFDYEERPGADAAHFQYNLGDGFSSLELAYAPNFRKAEESTAGLLYKANWKGYDWQVLAGYSVYDVVFGGGWAGAIGGAGFKGEWAYYHSTDSLMSESNFTGTIGFDYVFGSGLYGSVSYLYNGVGSLNPSIVEQLELRQSRLSSKNIFPYRHTLMVSISHPLGMLWNVDLTWFQSHNLDQAALVPGLRYSISNNWDAMILAQIFSARNAAGDPALFTSAVYARLKWSF